MPTFAGKQWNGQVFAKYLETVPRVKQDAFIKAGIFRNRADLRNLFTEQTGGNYAAVPMTGLIGGTADNYDGSSDVTFDTLGSYLHGMIVIGRMHGWKEQDFSAELTQKNFMQEIASQTAGYWDDIDQGLVLSTLKGIFGMTTKDGGFVDAHTYDISSDTDPLVGATTLNSAIQQACGANKNIFTLSIVHSVIATNLENLQVVGYAKGTDANGIQKDVALATWNGRTIMIDDECPYDSSAGTYESYVLGTNAFDTVDCGAKQPAEPYRDPIKTGGVDMLIQRQRKVFAPRGISFVQNSSIISPTNEQLETGANWQTCVDAKDGTTYFDHKAIPIVRIISKG